MLIQPVEKKPKNNLHRIFNKFLMEQRKFTQKTSFRKLVSRARFQFSAMHERLHLLQRDKFLLKSADPSVAPALRARVLSEAAYLKTLSKSRA